MGRAYCNLGLAHLALGNLETALECQKYFLAIAHMTQHLQGKFRALGNIGDVLIKMGDVEEAVKMYQRQLGFARQVCVKNIFFCFSEKIDQYLPTYHIESEHKDEAYVSYKNPLHSRLETDH